MTDYVAAVTVSRPISLKAKIATLFSTIGTTFQNTTTSFTSKTGRMDNKKRVGILILIIILVVVLIGGAKIALTKAAFNKSTNQLGTVSADALTVPIDREFLFVVYDNEKKPADQVKYTLTTAQLTKQIIIKGQKANAVKGRTFLIINLKLVNDFNKSLFLNTRNYVRVQPIGINDRLAPEIHNDTVEVQPLSTKITRIGLPVDDNVKQFTLFVGDLEGEKTAIPLKF